MNDLISLLVIAIICTVIGFALGLLISSLRSSKEQPQKSTSSSNSSALMKFVLPRMGAGWRLELDGKTFIAPNQLTARQRNRLMQAVAELRTWVDRPEATGDGAVAAVTGSAGSSPPADMLASPAPEDTGKSRVSMNPIDMFARAIQTDTGKLDQSPKSIAAQIDEILQEKLENSPLENRGIRLMELPGKGMVVMVGLNQYDGVDSVPNPEIRELIKSCVAEWERRVS